MSLAAVFTLGLPIALIAGNVWYITNSEWLYSYDWWRNDIAERSGISVDQLNSAADQIKAYFNDDSERLDVNVIFNGVPTALYNEREILHMVDVKALILLVRDAGIWAGIASGVSALLGALMLRSRFILTFSRLVRASAVLTAVTAGALVIAMIINFNWVFTQFHLISFANDLWLLNPFRDYLLIMFPARFFFEAALFVAVLTAISYILIMILFSLLRRLNRKTA